MKSNYIMPGTELTHKTKTVYYEQQIPLKDKHVVYFCEGKWPFPKRVTLRRDQFRVKKFEKEKFDLSQFEDALF